MSYRIAKKGGQLIGATFADFETAERFIKHRPDSLPEATILLDCDDSYQWVGITQALKERDELAAELEGCQQQSVKFANDVLRESENVATLEKSLQQQKEHYERIIANAEPELSAELEQWKTNFSHAMDTANDIYEQKLEVLAELDSLKSRLPVNADGDVPDIGDEQWIWHENHGPSPTEIHGIRDDGDGWYYIGPDDCGINPLTCHSTAESCRAAHEKGE